MLFWARRWKCNLRLGRLERFCFAVLPHVINHLEKTMSANLQQQIVTRPMLFSGPMVRALLDGRKTQTRRLLKQKKRKDGCELVPELLQRIGVGHACPYGVIGDRLWVREAFYGLCGQQHILQSRWRARPLGRSEVEAINPHAA
jgi:hypothetical protein